MQISHSQNLHLSRRFVYLYIGNGVSHDLFKNDSILFSNSNLTSYKTTLYQNGDSFRVKAYSNLGCSQLSQKASLNVSPVPAKPVIMHDGKNTLSG
ncbi:MAG: hypothetical protein R2852_07910 [Bacteroidia bacterium]